MKLPRFAVLVYCFVVMALTGSGTALWGQTGALAYVANQNSNNISAYSIDAATGALSLVGNFATGALPRWVTVDPSGQFVYVANHNGGSVSGYTITVGTGALTPISGSPFPVGIMPHGVTVHPSGQFAYVTNCGTTFCFGSGTGSVSAYTIDGTTGALSSVDGSPFTAGTGAFGVAVEPSGQFAYVTNFSSSNVTAYMIDSVTGALAPIGNFPAGSAPVSIAVTAGPPPPPATAARK
jgi:6-phosphogluconolactonase (cycloisomerase 2 family)